MAFDGKQQRENLSWFCVCVFACSWHANKCDCVKLITSTNQQLHKPARNNRNHMHCECDIQSTNRLNVTTAKMIKTKMKKMNNVWLSFSSFRSNLCPVYNDETIFSRYCVHKSIICGNGECVCVGCRSNCRCAGVAQAFLVKVIILLNNEIHMWTINHETDENYLHSSGKRNSEKIAHES